MTTFLKPLALTLGGALISTSVWAAPTQYRVTITNLTAHQVLSPPVVSTHEANFEIFAVKEPASMGLSQLAEDGDTALLVQEIQGRAGSASVLVAPTGIMPGQSFSTMIKAEGRARSISIAAMLASTNDGFLGLSNLPLPAESVVVDGFAFDAGTEANTEMCAHIPGPPCGSHHVRMTEGAEGFVQLHPGIKGIGDLNAMEFGWDGPVARISVEKMD